MPKKSKTSKLKSTYPIGKQAGKQQVEKEPDFFQKHKSTIWTILVLVLLAVFFVINNTRRTPDQGSYPPNYLKGNTANETLE